MSANDQILLTCISSSDTYNSQDGGLRLKKKSLRSNFFKLDLEA